MSAGAKAAAAATDTLALAAAGHACPVERALAIVGAKWTLLIVHNLMTGPKRFGELERAIAGASPKMLTARLRELERLGLVSRTIHAEVPPRVEYALTEPGRSLKPIIDSLYAWGGRLHASRRGSPR